MTGFETDWQVDTNAVFRRDLPDDPFHLTVRHAIGKLNRGGAVLHVTSQNLLEVKALVTRPIAANGLGISSDDARELSDLIGRDDLLLPETLTPIR